MYGGENACRFATDQYVDERIILKGLLRKLGGSVLTGLM
jgi:hypothetical protein